MSRAFQLRNKKDFFAGLLYIAVGAGFAIGATHYNHGEAARMGPGYFPFWLGVLLAAVGVFVTIAAIRPGAAMENFPKMDFRPLAWILGSLVLFAFILQPLGLALSIFILVMISSVASHEFAWKGALLNALLLLAIALGAFIYGLHLQLPVWPSFIG
ncbi:MAG: tripartite tricarboxylate transporter TctB family protein [Pseudomonadota bacterium]